MIEDALKANDSVVDIIRTGLSNFKEKPYTYVLECTIIIEKKTFSIIVCIPKSWQRELIDIYIKDYNKIPFIPHVDNEGKVCLFELEGALIDKNLAGILTQSINRAIDIVSSGLQNKNQLDFINEFELYWCQLPHKKCAYVTVPRDKNIQVMKYAIKEVKRRKKEKFSGFYQRQMSNLLYVGESSQELERWKLGKIIVKNCLYIYREFTEYLFPPDIRNEIDINYVNKLLKDIDSNALQKIHSKVKDDKLFIFEIKQPNGVFIFLGFIIEDCELEFTETECSICKYSKIYPVSIKRNDKQYLMSRTNTEENKLKNKRILLIGCGSIGGYVANELVKAGVENMLLVDNDLLQGENIFRHLLGMEYVQQYKCIAIVNYLKKNIPDIHITSLAENIEDAIQEDAIDFNQFDLIISAVGSHNVNRWINEYIFANKITVPVVYAWNEVLGIGNHISYIQFEKNGCFECFLGRSEETGEIYDKTSYCLAGQKITKNLNGCGSTFIPYESTISLKTAITCVETIKKIFEERYSDNIIISSKGDRYYFEQAGLKVSNKYTKQINETTEYIGNQFKNKKCEVCGNKYGI